MVTAPDKTLFGILMDVVATADVLVEQLEYVKRHPEVRQQRADELADMLLDNRQWIETPDGELIAV